MPSINRSTYMTPVQRGTMPGGYDAMSTGPSTRAMIHFDQGGKGLQRRIGVWQDDPALLRQGCQRTGRNIGPPGFEQPEYDCPFPIVGTPAWSQPYSGRRTVFDGMGFAPFPHWATGALLIGFTAAALYWLYEDRSAARRNPLSKDMAEAWMRLHEAYDYYEEGDWQHVRLRLDEAWLHGQRLPANERWEIAHEIQRLQDAM